MSTFNSIMTIYFPLRTVIKKQSVDTAEPQLFVLTNEFPNIKVTSAHNHELLLHDLITVAVWFAQRFHPLTIQLTEWEL